MSMTAPSVLPDNVPGNIVVDYSFYTEPEDADVQLEASRKLHAGADIIWTFRNGGHWIFTRVEDIEFAQRDSDLFSMREIVLPAGTSPNPVIPLESDEPEHMQYRAVLAPAFLPNKLIALEAGVRKLAGDLIEAFKPKGECEFVSDFAAQLPIVIFMRLADLPMEDRAMLTRWSSHVSRPPVTADRIAAYAGMNAYIANVMEERRNSAGDDIISMVMRGRMKDRDMTYIEKQQMIANALFGGLDTVTSTMSFVARFLADHPDQRRLLIEDPSLQGRAIEEILRRYGVANTARVITRDFERKGIQFKEGDRVLLPTMLHGLDERRWPNPQQVDFKREDVRHATFGNGSHRCLGALLARLEIKIFTSEWLARIPDFEVDPTNPPKVEGGTVNSVVYLPLRWAV